MKIFLTMLAQVNQEPPPFLSFLPFVLMFGVFYFILIRPQRKQQAEHEEMVKSLTRNDEVVTTGGLHGTVVALKEKSVLVRIAENVKVEVDRSAIARVEKSRSEGESLVEDKTK